MSFISYQSVSDLHGIVVTRLEPPTVLTWQPCFMLPNLKRLACFQSMNRCYLVSLLTNSFTDL